MAICSFAVATTVLSAVQLCRGITFDQIKKITDECVEHNYQVIKEWEKETPPDEKLPMSKLTEMKTDKTTIKTMKLLKIYKREFKRNFGTKCGYWKKSLTDLRDMVLPDSFLAIDKYGLTEKETAEFKKSFQNPPIVPVVMCVRNAVHMKSLPGLTADDVKEFDNNFGDGSEDAGNELLLVVLRNARCPGKHVDVNAKDILSELKEKMPPTSYTQKLQNLFKACVALATCLLNRRDRPSLPGDIFGCNGNWDFWNKGFTCWDEVKASKSTKLDKEYREMKLPSKLTSLEESPSPVARLWRRFYNALCRRFTSKKASHPISSNDEEGAKMAAAEDARKEQKKTFRRRRIRDEDDAKQCLTFIVTTILFAFFLCGSFAYGFAQAGSLGGLHGAAAAASVGGAIGFLLGAFIGGFMTGLSGKCKWDDDDPNEPPRPAEELTDLASATSPPQS